MWKNVLECQAEFARIFLVESLCECLDRWLFLSVTSYINKDEKLKLMFVKEGYANG